MANFFSLPIEIRDQIVEAVLFASPFPCPDVPPQRKCISAPMGRNDWHSCVYYPNRTWPCKDPRTGLQSALPLLLTLGGGVNSLLARRNIAVIDIAIVDGSWLLPTHRFVPLRTEIVQDSLSDIVNKDLDYPFQAHALDRLNINVSLCQTENDRDNPTAPEQVPALARTVTYALCRLLERFLALNISDLKAMTWAQSAQHNVGVRCLDFDFATHRKDWHLPISQHEVPGRSIENFAHLNLETLFPVIGEQAVSFSRAIMEELIGLIEGTSPSIEGVELIGTCGRIEFRMDGEPKARRCFEL